MKKTRKILSFIMALVITFTNINLNAAAMETDILPALAEESSNLVTISQNKVEKPQLQEEQEEEEAQPSPEEEGELAMPEEEVEEEEEEAQPSPEEEGELAMPEEQEEEAEEIQPSPEEEGTAVTEDCGFMELEMEPIEIEEEEVYFPQELVEIAQSMPSYLSQTYELYGDKYTSYYIYNQLDEETKVFWEAMEIVYSGYLGNDTDISTSHAGVWKINTNGKSLSQIQGMLLLFKYTHPQYYFLSNKVFYNKSFKDGDPQITIGFGVYEKFKEGAVRKSATEQMVSLVDTWIAEMAQIESEEKKIQFIHDKICNKVDYNDGVTADGRITQEEEEAHFTQSAYSVFGTGLTVCAGYTQAFTWLCNAVDIEVLGVTSTDHAWNKVKVKDNWYNVDCTWDDGDGIGNRTYHYYLRNDDYYDTHGKIVSHQEEEQWLEYLPSCTLDSGSYGTVVGAVPNITTQMGIPQIQAVYGEGFCTITMTPGSEGEKIYYTLDGKLPSEAGSKSFIYKAPFIVEEAAQLKAVVVGKESLDSQVVQMAIQPGANILMEGNWSNGVIWRLDGDGCLLLSGSGDSKDFMAPQSAPWLDVSEKITGIVIEEGITGIGAGAFRGLQNLTTVTVPQTVTVIGTEAFAGCMALEKIIIPQNVTSIGENAFPFSTKVVGELGSTAQKYAEENGYEFVDTRIDAVPMEDFRVEGFVQESPEMVYTGKEITQNISVYHKDKLLVENVDYILKYRNNVNPAAYDTLNAPSLTIIMKGQYEGERTLYYTILPRESTEEEEIPPAADRKMEDVFLGADWKEEIPFSQTRLREQGGVYPKGTKLLSYEGKNGLEDLVEGEDHTAKYTKADKVGNVTVIFYGKGRYEGTLKKTYSIIPNVDLEAVWAETDRNNIPLAYYQKDGAVPEFQLLDADGNLLKKGTDYNIRTKDNQKLGTMYLEIVGIGNYNGYRLQTDAWIIPGDIGKCIMAAEDTKYSQKKNAWKSSVEIRDRNGHKLSAGKDYEKEILYTYENMEEDSVPEIGTVIQVTVIGKNNYAGSVLTGSYQICEKDLEDLQIVIDSKEYTGQEVKLLKSDIHVYADWKDRKAGKEMTQDCYKIAAYEKNDRVGIASVTLQGKGEYGGTRKCYFVIYKKLFDTVKVEKIELEEKNLVLAEGQTKTLGIKIYPENAENKTVIWSSMDESIASVEKNGTVTAKKEGTVTIKAVSQDGGKTAVCNLKVKNIPMDYFELNASRVEGYVNETYQLEILGIQPENANDISFLWKSSDAEIVSVDENGMLSLNKEGVAVVTVSRKDSSCIQKCVVWVKSQEGDEIPQNFLTPQEFKEDSDTDDTASFNRAINNLVAAGCDTVYVPSGTYQIDASVSIRLKSNMKLIMSPEAVLEAIPNSLSVYNIIYINNASNTMVSGGQIAGERYEHGSLSGEWGMGIGVYDSEDIIISDVKITDCWGDGIYIGSNNDDDLNLGCENITITNCILDNNRRNNLSIVNGDDVTVDGCSFKNANGTAPEYGIDIETNNEENPCEHIRISNSHFTGNVQGSLGIITKADDIIISNCILKERVINYAGTNVIISNSELYDKVYARTGIVMLNRNVFNAGTEAEDTLVASFDAGRDPFAIGKYNIDSSNTMLGSYMDSDLSPSGRVLRMERIMQGTKESGYYLNLSDLMKEGNVKLEAGCTYRFEYMVRGYGQWGVKTDQTPWYPCVPQSDRFVTGMTFYEATDKGTPYRIIFFAQEMKKSMSLEVDSIRIYKVN